jgi:hypothetical protein
VHKHSSKGTIAQLVEQRTFNPFVVGSTPAGPTRKSKKALCISVQSAFFMGVGGAPRPHRKSLQMTIESNRQDDLNKMVLCEPCSGIQRHWRRAPGHAELVQGTNRKEQRESGPVTITRYRCDRCGTAWEYENNKADQQAGWAVIGG